MPADDLVGTEPDPRFTLANERTFLAWNRTALALVGGGVAIGQLVDFHSEAMRLVCALAPVALGALLAVESLRRWAAVQRAMRLGEPLPPARTTLALGVGVVVVALAVATALVVDVLTG